MSKSFLLLTGICVLLILATISFMLYRNRQSPSFIKVVPTAETPTTLISPTTTPLIFHPPLSNSTHRVTKKKFSTLVSPNNSPVSPEKFTGFHTGIDFETDTSESDVDIEVSAICNGKLIFKQWVSGYGGALVQQCELKNDTITVIYGHLNIDSINKTVGSQTAAGEILGKLGKGYSKETDGERKHLHLGIHKGSSVELKGYVSSESQLKDWVDPCEFFCN